jgi:hypothetical protein
VKRISSLTDTTAFIAGAAGAAAVWAGGVDEREEVQAASPAATKITAMTRLPLAIL